jgi:hypothetical protein
MCFSICWDLKKMSGTRILFCTYNGFHESFREVQFVCWHAAHPWQHHCSLQCKEFFRPLKKDICTSWWMCTVCTTCKNFGNMASNERFCTGVGVFSCHRGRVGRCMSCGFLTHTQIHMNIHNAWIWIYTTHRHTHTHTHTQKVKRDALPQPLGALPGCYPLTPLPLLCNTITVILYHHNCCSVTP